MNILGINNLQINDDGTASFKAMIKNNKKINSETMKVKLNEEIIDLASQLQKAVIKAKASE